jgi:hypothetical protein
MTIRNLQNDVVKQLIVVSCLFIVFALVFGFRSIWTGICGGGVIVLTDFCFLSGSVGAVGTRSKRIGNSPVVRFAVVAVLLFIFVGVLSVHPVGIGVGLLAVVLISLARFAVFAAGVKQQ